MELQVDAYAKINLSLDVLDRREDGYHNIDTIMQEIDLKDVITIETGRGGFVLTSNHTLLELDDRNLVYRAWDALKDLAPNPSVSIHIEKNIPIAAGLAGGSTDCAATLKGLNEFWDLGLSLEELQEIGLRIGSDVPFCLQGGTCRARGRGEILTPLKDYSDVPILLLNIGKPISTKYVYDHLSRKGKVPMDTIVEAFQNGNPSMYELFANAMEEVSFDVLPELKTWKEELLKTGAQTALMSGSGPTLFAIYQTEEEAHNAAMTFHGRVPFVYVTRTR